ncbi:GCG_CRPN prefix-to-repeats domain-containing protein [Acidomonas methanolica]|uniref:GCG_CRPN prefix-to-repeats domain-containing protein n=1 Tax=Acidomonas methanolica TaxID=437 RepID=UPI0009DD0497|nr:hypothetical protein [Acidomonas methanolica]TCS26365.1 hypothetical protein EDC31_1147 [Acidomonas methanolica]
MKQSGIVRAASLVAIMAGALAGCAPTSYAAQGCGIGWHRGPYGRCDPNRPPPPVVVAAPPGPLVVARPPPAIGVYYRGRGWWDGHRYWWHRYRWHGGWRYR